MLLQAICLCGNGVLIPFGVEVKCACGRVYKLELIEAEK